MTHRHALRLGSPGIVLTLACAGLSPVPAESPEPKAPHVAGVPDAGPERATERVTHCAPDEEPVFSCATSRDKTLSICGRVAMTGGVGTGWFQYRFGKLGAVEMRYPDLDPELLRREWEGGGHARSFALTQELGGAGVAYELEFHASSATYTVYETTYRDPSAGDAPRDTAGVRVAVDGRSTDIRCAAPVLGNLGKLVALYPEGDPPGSDSWAGEWTRFDHKFGGASLTVHDETPTSFQFELLTNNGAHIGSIEGQATLGAARETATFTEGECSVSLARREAIEVTTTGCDGYGGVGVWFDGRFDRGGAREADGPTYTLLEAGVLDTEAQYQAFLAMVGPERNRFDDVIQAVSEDPDLDGFGAKVRSGAPRGLYTINEGIVMSTPDSRLWAAVLDDGKVYYFSNAAEWKSRLPKTIDDWRSRFADAEVIYAK